MSRPPEQLSKKSSSKVREVLLASGAVSLTDLQRRLEALPDNLPEGRLLDLHTAVSQLVYVRRDAAQAAPLLDSLEEGVRKAGLAKTSAARGQGGAPTGKAPKAKPSRTRAVAAPGQPPHVRRSAVDPEEDPGVFAEMSIFDLRPHVVVDGGDSKALMQNFAYMMDQPIHPDAARRADEIYHQAWTDNIQPSREANAQLKAWRMLGSATMKSSTQAKQAVQNWDEADSFVTDKALDPHFKASPGELMALMTEINAKLLTGIKVKGKDGDEDAQPGMRFGTDAAAGMDTGGHDLNPTRMYLPGSDVENATKDLCTWLSAELAKEDTNPIELAARTYQEVVSIHPFHDANGRSARFVMDFVLQRKGLLPAALGDDVNLCCFPRIDPDHQPSPTGALNVVMKGIERSYAQVKGKKQPAGPLPALSEAPDALVTDLRTHERLLASYDVPVDALVKQYTALAKTLAAMKQSEWPAQAAGAKGALTAFRKLIGQMPVLRKEVGKLADAIDKQVTAFDATAAQEAYRRDAPRDAAGWVAARPEVLAPLVQADEGKVKAVQQALAQCLAVKTVARLEDLGLPFDAREDRWMQLLEQQVTKELNDALGVLTQQIAVGLPGFVVEALGAVRAPFDADVVRLKKLIETGARPLYEQLAKASGVNIGGPTEEEVKQQRLEAVGKLTTYLAGQRAPAWATDVQELTDLCNRAADALRSGAADRVNEAALALKERIERVGMVRRQPIRLNGGNALLAILGVD